MRGPLATVDMSDPYQAVSSELRSRFPHLGTDATAKAALEAWTGLAANHGEPKVADVIMVATRRLNLLAERRGLRPYSEPRPSVISLAGHRPLSRACGRATTSTHPRPAS